MTTFDGVAARLETVRARVRQAAERAGRNPADVTLVAVSKRHGADAIRAAYAAGQRDFGESYVQELCDKAADLRDLPDVRFHMIGHVQSNKLAKLLPAVHVLHSVDRSGLVAELDKRRALRAGLPPLGVFVQVNVAREPQKSGAAPEGVPALLDAVEALGDVVTLRGLMTIPPDSDDPSVARRAFDALVALRDANGGVDRMPALSMGMSGDLDEAIAAGSTLVRVGTAIFGERPARVGG